MSLFSYNAAIKYPLSDFDENEIPTDILLDLSLNCPDGYEPMVGALRCLAGTFFISIEDVSTQEAIAHAYVPRAQQYRTYRLDMDVPGFGWITLGPGALDDYYSEGVTAAIAHEAYTRIPVTAPEFSLGVDGLAFSLKNALEIQLGTNLLSVQVVPPDTLIFARNDNVLLDEDIEALTVVPGEIVSDRQRFIYRLGLATPDDEGNITISVEGCVPNCKDTYKLQVPRGDTGLGEAGELPLDIFSPRDYLAGDPCTPSTFSGASSTEHEGCHEILLRAITDPYDDHDIGLVFYPSY